MWKCKKCGRGIYKSVSGEFEGTECPLDRDGNCFDIDVLSLEVREYTYCCENCAEESDNIEDIADWVD